MPGFGFEPTIPVFERANTVHALDCAATVMGDIFTRIINYSVLVVLTWFANLFFCFSNISNETEDKI
jgi:hypothetical protein